MTARKRLRKKRSPRAFALIAERTWNMTMQVANTSATNADMVADMCQTKTDVKITDELPAADDLIELIETLKVVKAEKIARLERYIEYREERNKHDREEIERLKEYLKECKK